MRLFPGTPNVVVFDTAFHQTMPPHAHVYALPYGLCAVAVDVFVYQVRKQIGAYAAAMNGLDALVFTAGIGENSAEIRSRICAGLGVLGVSVDQAANDIARKGNPDISAADARVATLVVPTDEELMIAIDTLALTTEPASGRSAA